MHFPQYFSATFDGEDDNLIGISGATFVHMSLLQIEWSGFAQEQVVFPCCPELGGFAGSEVAKYGYQIFFIVLVLDQF
jgi:hypothetical protein